MLRQRRHRGALPRVQLRNFSAVVSARTISRAIRSGSSLPELKAFTTAQAELNPAWATWRRTVALE
ncbi:hypothetical protein ACFQ0T_06845 [Kitasatospora gansuensis]